MLKFNNYYSMITEKTMYLIQKFTIEISGARIELTKDYSIRSYSKLVSSPIIENGNFLNNDLKIKIEEGRILTLYYRGGGSLGLYFKVSQLPKIGNSILSVFSSALKDIEFIELVESTTLYL